MDPFILENTPFLVLTASLFLAVTKMFPENIHLYVGFIGIWFFLWDVKQKIVDDTNSRETMINTTIVKEISKIRAEINNDLTAKINSHDTNYVTEVHRILDRVTTRLETYHDHFNRIATEFNSINESIATLQSANNQCYALIQSTGRSESGQQSETDQSEISSLADSSTGSSNSSQRFANVTSIIRERFTDIFNRVKGANDYTLDRMCTVISADILELGMGSIEEDTVKGFYNGDSIESENLKRSAHE